MTIEKLYTPKEVATLLSINYITLLKLLRSEKIKSVKIDRQYRVKESDLEQYLKQ